MSPKASLFAKISGDYHILLNATQNQQHGNQLLMSGFFWDTARVCGYRFPNDKKQ